MFAPGASDSGFGVHIGYADSGSEMGVSCDTDSSLRCLTFSPKNTTDLLGVYRTEEFGNGWSGLLMAGLSRVDGEIEVEDEVFSAGPDGTYNTPDDIEIGGLDDSATHNGYKLVAGMQKTFGNNLSWQALVSYADYGQESYRYGDLESKVDFTTLEIQIGIAYHF